MTDPVPAPRPTLEQRLKAYLARPRSTTSSVGGFPVERLLCGIAVVCFAVAAFGGHIASLNLVDIGLAFFAGGHVV